MRIKKNEQNLGVRKAGKNTSIGKASETVTKKVLVLEQPGSHPAHIE